MQGGGRLHLHLNFGLHQPLSVAFVMFGKVQVGQEGEWVGGGRLVLHLDCSLVLLVGGFGVWLYLHLCTSASELVLLWSLLSPACPPLPCFHSLPFLLGFVVLGSL